jgi:hypothetical protein
VGCEPRSCQMKGKEAELDPELSLQLPKPLWSGPSCSGEGGMGRPLPRSHHRAKGDTKSGQGAGRGG